ncbi:hypothetical protein G7Y89_g6125 [Cudoniella acicularis]|uniref:Uncharacterized protein n=1 Tax=Cudoniella acicularis TaxID=354080 RepID=A0A8H4W3B5_9HELO|nr:hypothetical protein G7Y89_g6125 [Cudoniella acicularis]
MNPTACATHPTTHQLPNGPSLVTSQKPHPAQYIGHRRSGISSHLIPPRTTFASFPKNVLFPTFISSVSLRIASYRIVSIVRTHQRPPSRPFFNVVFPHCQPQSYLRSRAGRAKVRPHLNLNLTSTTTHLTSSLLRDTIIYKEQRNRPLNDPSPPSFFESSPPIVSFPAVPLRIDIYPPDPHRVHSSTPNSPQVITTIHQPYNTHSDGVTAHKLRATSSQRSICSNRLHSYINNHSPDMRYFSPMHQEL